jgi:hypothetical protein
MPVKLWWWITLVALLACAAAAFAVTFLWYGFLSRDGLALAAATSPDLPIWKTTTVAGADPWLFAHRLMVHLSLLGFGLRCLGLCILGLGVFLLVLVIRTSRRKT